MSTRDWSTYNMCVWLTHMPDNLVPIICI